MTFGMKPHVLILEHKDPFSNKQYKTVKLIKKCDVWKKKSDPFHKTAGFVCVTKYNGNPHIDKENSCGAIV